MEVVVQELPVNLAESGPCHGRDDSHSLHQITYHTAQLTNQCEDYAQYSQCFHSETLSGKMGAFCSHRGRFGTCPAFENYDR